MCFRHKKIEGKETILNKTDFISRIVKYARGYITEEEAFRLDVWYKFFHLNDLAFI